MAGNSRIALLKERLPSGRVFKRAALGGVLLAGATAAADFGYAYWTVGRFLESTDDAYIKADYTTIAPKVPGYIAAVLVRDNEAVRRGQVLARIDDRDYRAALAQARADVAAADAAIGNLDAQVVLQQSIIEQQKAAIAATEATLKFAREDHARYADLMRSGAGTLQRAQQAESTLREKTAQLQSDMAGLLAAQKKIDVLLSERGQAVAQRDRSRAAEQQAELNLSYTTITAPVDGTVGARSLRVGQFVQSGAQLMAVVPLHAVYVVANFKETQLTHVRSGQRVRVRVDGFPDTTLTGHVDSLSPASGLEFALLPPDNATGNFTKIVQRIPVRIVLDDSALTGRLRAGMSVVPSIDTKAAAMEGPAPATPPADGTPAHRLSETPKRHPAAGS
ncbi:HlyD family secretion protein [Reyranella sp. CPCC 100927]|uniref:HlyD family secretion protein n=1 Tax=Reyranella sp. CPCC 100927 TaxID=2599616 RepID=UPI0011B8001E|nr:HlyD family secretion protein [Reyranella sp. CPCC 100927]TWT10516.1 HlyD family secretion protein [Reyranella sp. CPCC 100927]